MAKSANEQDMVTAQDLAKAVAESYNTIDYWSERGILAFKRRGRRRLYNLKKNIRRIRLTRDRQDRGHSIDGILDEIRRQGI